MKPKIALDWNSIVQFINRGVAEVLAYMGFWKMGWWAQMFTVVMMLIAVILVMMGPLIFAAFRLFRDGERPSLVGAVFVLASSATGSLVLLILFRLAQQVANRHPGPIL
jgi:hypothetical protein